MTEPGYGYCRCGCGQKTTIATQTHRSRGWVKGEPKQFVRGHRPKKPQVMCGEEGCGEPALARALCRKHYQRWDKARHPGRNDEYQARYNERHPGKRAEHARARYAANPQRGIEHSRRSNVKRKYGLTLEEYETILARGCAICGAHGPRMAMDHDHANGKVRDALCANCNNGLGRFKDDPDRLRAAAEYLDRHRA